MKFDEVLEKIGGFGAYQKWVFFLTCYLYTLSGFYILNPVFLLGVPLHRCAIPDYDNDTYEIQSVYHQQLVNKTIPPSDIDKEEYDRCRLYQLTDVTGTNNTEPLSQGFENSTLVKCHRWVYDKSVFKETFVSQIDLVCDKEFWVANAEMLLYFGMLVGSFGSGILADRYGRKPVMYLSILIMTGAALGLAWANTYALFVILQFLLGASSIGTFMPAYIISFEMTSAKKRVWPGVVAELPYIFGLIAYAAIAYALKDWFYIQLYVAIPAGFGIFFWWWMPESPRWLLLKGRVQEAESVIRRAARWNKANLPETIFDKKTIDDEAANYTSAGCLSLFSSKTMLIRSLLIFFNWIVVSFVYFGLALNTDNLNGNVYLNFGISGAVEIPGVLLVVALIDRVGRRRLYFVTMVVGGVSCISTLLAVEYAADIEELPVVLAMIGKLCVTSGYSVQYVHAAELFPTALRNAGLGCASLFARVGTMVAPYVVNLGEHIGGTSGEAFPLAVFGVMSFLSAVLSLLLPETLNKNLPETVEEGEKFGKGLKVVTNSEVPDQTPP